MPKRKERKSGLLLLVSLLVILVCVAFYLDGSRSFLIVVFHRIMHDPWIFLVFLGMILGGILGFWYSLIDRRFGNPHFVYISNTYWLGIIPLPVPGTPTISLFILGMGVYFFLEWLGLI